MALPNTNTTGAPGALKTAAQVDSPTPAANINTPVPPVPPAQVPTQNINPSGAAFTPGSRTTPAAPGDQPATQSQVAKLAASITKNVASRVSDAASPSSFLQRGLVGALGNNPITQLITGIGGSIGDAFSSMLESPQEEKQSADIGKLVEVLKTNTTILDGILDAIFRTNSLLSKLNVSGEGTKTRSTNAFSKNKSFVKEQDQSQGNKPIKLTVFDKKGMANNLEQLYGKKEEPTPVAEPIAPLVPNVHATVATVKPETKKTEDSLKAWELIILGKNKEAIKAFGESLQKVTKTFSKTVDEVSANIKKSAKKNEKITPSVGNSTAILTALTKKEESKNKAVVAGLGKTTLAAVADTSRTKTANVAAKIAGARVKLAAPAIAASNIPGKIESYDEEQRKLNAESGEKESDFGLLDAGVVGGGVGGVALAAKKAFEIAKSGAGKALGNAKNLGSRALRFATGMGTRSVAMNALRVAGRVAGPAALAADAGAAGYYVEKAFGGDQLGEYLGGKAHDIFSSDNDKIEQMLKGKPKLQAEPANNNADRLVKLIPTNAGSSTTQTSTVAPITINAPVQNQNTTILPSRTIIRNPEQSVNRYLNNSMGYK